jgi:hypothetical protein
MMPVVREKGQTRKQRRFLSARSAKCEVADA